MKQRILFLFFLLTTSLCFGQKEHLKPSEDISKYRGLPKWCFDKVSKGFSEKPYAYYACMPHFSGEYAFSIEKKKENYYIISNTLSKNRGSTRVRIFVTVRKNKLKIDYNLYVKVGELFELLREQTKEPDNPKPIFGFEAVAYYFATANNDGEVFLGVAWSPDANSLLGRLVDICDKLYLIGSKEDISQTDILKDIDKLINDFKE